jgi:hypothetical protein
MNTPPQRYHALAAAHGRDFEREADVLRRRRHARRHASPPATSPAARRSRLSVLATLIASLVWPTPTVHGAGRVGPPGTVWVGNRGFPALATFDAATGEHLHTAALEAPASDVAVVRVPERSRRALVLVERVFVGEESADQVTLIEAESAAVITRIETASRPHHLEASNDGAVGHLQRLRHQRRRADRHPTPRPRRRMGGEQEPRRPLPHLHRQRRRQDALRRQ